MPLRDHFQPPMTNVISWEGFHGMWPAYLVAHLLKLLPAGYSVEPKIHLGKLCEVDIATFEPTSRDWGQSLFRNDSGGTATATWAPPKPTVDCEDSIDDEYEYSVNVYQLDHEGQPNRKLVAAIELVSPANKDRPLSRRALVSKCAALLRRDICISLVDLVVPMKFNLYADLLDILGQTDPTFSIPSPSIYAATVHRRKDGIKKRIETYGYSLEVGKALPSIPIWLDQTNGVMLDLEASYVETCQALRIR